VTLPDSEDPPSPCRRVCVLEGQICLGCGRSLDEIAGWPGASVPEKHRILRAAGTRLGAGAKESGRPK